MQSTSIIPNKSELLKAYSEFLPALVKIISGIENDLKSHIKILSIPMYKTRLKSFESYYKKLLRVKPSSLGVQKLPVLSDLIGIRVVCAFLEDLQVVERQIGELFTVKEIERKGADRTFREFGYESTHILIQIPEQYKENTELPEGLLCEIQIRTILQDAWAEVEHELVYKSEFSPFDLPLKRKLASMNASLSLADIIFQEIRDYQNRLNRELDMRRSTFYEKAEHITRTKFEGENQIKPIQTAAINSTSPYVQGTIDDLLLTAIHAHNNGNLETAVSIYTQITQSKPEPNAVILSVIYKHRGLAYFAQSKYELAFDDFLQSSKLNPNEPRSFYYCGIVCSILGDEAHAVEYFTKSISLNEYQSHVYYRRALSLFHLGDYGASVSDLDKGKALGLDDDDCQKLRATLLKKLKMD